MVFEVERIGNGSLFAVELLQDFPLKIAKMGAAGSTYKYLIERAGCAKLGKICTLEDEFGSGGSAAQIYST